MLECKFRLLIAVSFGCDPCLHRGSFFLKKGSLLGLVFCVSDKCLPAFGQKRGPTRFFIFYKWNFRVLDSGIQISKCNNGKNNKVIAIIVKKFFPATDQGSGRFRVVESCGGKSGVSTRNAFSHNFPRS
jgi:hypothetical protein